MESNKGFFNSRTHDLVNLFASIIGILGFLTGINNLPSIITGNGKELISWFESQISYWLSIPAFILTVFFVYGLYFLILVQIYKWLYWHEAVYRHFSWFELIEFVFRERSMLKIMETNLVSVFFFSTIGLALGGLIFQSFFGLSFWNELESNSNTQLTMILIIVASGIFLGSFCGLAQNTANHIVYELRFSRKEKA